MVTYAMIFVKKYFAQFWYFQEKEFIEPAKEIVLKRSKNEASMDEKLNIMEEKLQNSDAEIKKLNLKIDEILNILKTKWFSLKATGVLAWSIGSMFTAFFVSWRFKCIKQKIENCNKFWKGKNNCLTI